MAWLVLRVTVAGDVERVSRRLPARPRQRRWESVVGRVSSTSGESRSTCSAHHSTPCATHGTRRHPRKAGAIQVFNERQGFPPVEDEKERRESIEIQRQQKRTKEKEEEKKNTTNHCSGCAKCVVFSLARRCCFSSAHRTFLQRTPRCDDCPSSPVGRS